MTEKNDLEKIENNVFDTALIFEGGGMRAAFSSGILNVLLDNEIYFDYVTGISAGSSCTVNYISRDRDRAKRSFVDLVKDPNFGGFGSFFRGKGYFNAQYIYEEIGKEGRELPFDYQAFENNPARARVGAVDKERGELVYFTEKDMDSTYSLMKIVRSSSSLPILMPENSYQGRTYLDGGLAGGIPIDIAEKDGFEKFFVVVTRERGFRQKKNKRFSQFIRLYYRKYPDLAETIINREIPHNRVLDHLEELEREGRAYIVYPDEMEITTWERDYDTLEKVYQDAYKQGMRELPKWKSFLGI